jgi:hypothetical protein
MSRIKKWDEFFKESISGWEIIGKHMGPGYPEQESPTTLSQTSTQVILGCDDEFYTYDDYQTLYQSYLKDRHGILQGGFNKKNLDIIISSTKEE